MSKILENNELKELIKNALENTKNYLNNLIHTNSKKVMLISYWIIKYIKCLSNEETFKPDSLIRYKKRDIILVDFGFRIGKELGGIHYAVVLDNQNNLKSDVITVMPLTSQKEESKINHYKVLLPDGIFMAVHEIINDKIKLIEKINLDIKKIQTKLETEINNDEKYKLKKQLQKLCEQKQKKLEEIENQKAKIENMKTGSIANISQITTISKMRIVNPTNNKDTLYKARASVNDIKIIEESIKELYLYHPINKKK